MLVIDIWEEACRCTRRTFRDFRSSFELRRIAGRAAISAKTFIHIRNPAATSTNLPFTAWNSIDNTTIARQPTRWYVYAANA